jgi:hypothetical protein
MFGQQQTVNGVKRFFGFAPPSKNQPAKERLCLEEDTFKPFVCPSLANFLDEGDEKRIGKKVPLALIGTEDEEIRQKDTFFYTKGYSYVSLKPSKLFGWFASLEEYQRVLSCFVYPDHPVHIFFDLDWDESKLGPFSCKFETSLEKEAIQTAFLILFIEVFKETFGRMPRLKDKEMHWVDGCRPKKMSFHFHLLSEAFVTPQAFKDWITSRLLKHIEAEAKKGNTYALKLGRTVEGRFKCIIDESTASKNHLLRMGGNRKPGKPPLKWIPNIQMGSQKINETPLEQKELLFRSLVSYAITAEPHSFLVFTKQWQANTLSFSTLLKKEEDDQQRMEGKAQKGEMEVGRRKGVEKKKIRPEDFEWLKEIEIPWYEENKQAHPQPSDEILLFKETFPFIRFPGKFTICPACTEKNPLGGPVVHKSNHSILLWDYPRDTLIFRSMDNDCCHIPYKFPVPLEISLQTSHPDISLELSSAKFEGADEFNFPVMVSTKEYKKNQKNRRQRRAENQGEGRGFDNVMDQTKDWLLNLGHGPKFGSSSSSSSSKDASAGLTFIVSPFVDKTSTYKRPKQF